MGAGPSPADQTRAWASVRGLIRANGALLVLLLAFSLVTLWPSTPAPSADAPGARVALETTRTLTTLATAALLTVLGGGGARRAGFVAALVVLGLTDLVFGVVPYVIDLPGAQSSTVLPWVAARYLAGILFVMVGLERPSWPVRRVVAASVLAWAVLQLVVGAVVPDLPPQPDLSPISTAHVAVEAVPMLLFAVGAVLASRLHHRDHQPLDRWLAASLVVGVVSHVHEALHPVGFGPTVSSADLLRAIGTALLLVGAVQQVERLRADRARALELSQADLRELRTVSDALQAYVDHEASFRSVVTHELATPVATISAYAHVLHASQLPEGSQEAVATIAEEARRLRTLIERMDDLSGVGSDPLAVQTRPVAIAPLLHEAAAFGHAIPGSHPVSVQAEDVVVSADPTRLSQVLRNLVGNAARYTPSETPIRLVGRQTADGYEVLVADEGPGFGVDDAGALFAKYRRGGSARAVEGTGLGLWIVREVMREHGGSVTIDDPGLPGGRVRLVLPTGPAASSGGAA